MLDTQLSLIYNLLYQLIIHSGENEMYKVETMWEKCGEQGFECYVRLISSTNSQAFKYAMANGLKAPSARRILDAKEIDIRIK